MYSHLVPDLKKFRHILSGNRNSQTAVVAKNKRGNEEDHNMDGSIQVYYGNGRGKTTASLGLGIRAAAAGKQVIMVQFLKKKHSDTLELLKKLEPELKIFRFETTKIEFCDLTPEEQKEQMVNIKTALAYTRKVITADQCDILILDDILGLIHYEIISAQELIDLLSLRRETMAVLLTGQNLPDEIADYADCIYQINSIKEDMLPILT